MSNNRAVRSSQNFKPTKNKSNNVRYNKNTNFKSKDKPKYKSGAKPNNRVRDSGRVERQRGPPRRPQKKPSYRTSEKPSNRYSDRSRRDSDRGSKQLFDVICAKCKKETQVPFKPTGSKPVLCRECFQKDKPQDGSRTRKYTSSQSSSRYKDRTNRRTDGRSKQLYDATCATCNKETQVPFKPTGIKPVLCRDCFQNEKSGIKSPKQEYNSLTAVKEVVERFGDRSGPYRANKRMHQTICRKCKKEITIPFKPKANKKIYCQDCFQKIEKKE